MHKRVLFEILKKITPNKENRFTNNFVQYFDQQANDLIYHMLSYPPLSTGIMITKFGFTELHNLCSFLSIQEGLNTQKYREALHGGRDVCPDLCLNALCHYSGFFPNNVEYAYKWKDLVISDLPSIDILGSYLEEEKYLYTELSHCIKVNLEGYYAPFLWKNPWTKTLKGKKVLVIHPFIDSIKQQYEKRELLFSNPDVLPEFGNLYLLKAVQSIAGTKTEFKDWFEALSYMENEMDKFDYDIAIIGCGAYGMNLAAHAKRKGKIAIHMAGWTQMLFGIYGKRWIQDQPKFSKFINDSWIRPMDSERPSGANSVEGACYW